VTILSHLNERIASLKDMQQTEKAWDIANGWTPKSGGFTHSFNVHEGAESEGSQALGDTNDRAFSAWMSENIADFLWQAYHVTGNTDVPEMLRLLGNAIENHGFTTTFNGATYDRKTAFVGINPRANGCNTTGSTSTDLVYFTSAYADDATLASDDWYPWYSDSHNIETVLPLALAYKFESNSTNKAKLLNRINNIITGYTNATCAAISNTPRLWNWQNRSNSVRTWNRILREDS